MAVGKLCHDLTNFPREGGREGAHYTHPPRAAVGHPRKRQDLGNEGSSTTTRQSVIIVSITRSRENKPFISVCPQQKLGWLDSLPEAAGSPGR